MTTEQIARRAASMKRQHAQYTAFIERCERIVQQAHDLGWQVALMLNGERAVRNAESLLGVHLRADFDRSTPLSRLIYSV